jgi:hypothetical protein
MKTQYILAIVALIFGGWLRAEVPKDKAHTVPAAFESRDAAAKYVSGLFAGGDVDTLKVGKKEVLVVYVYGSGVPDIAIAAYRFSDGKWVLASEWSPPTVEIHKAVVSEGDVVVVGAKTGKKWILLKADENGG